LRRWRSVQNKQQQTIDELTVKLKVSIDQISLKQQTDQKEINAEIEKQNALQQEKVVKLEKYQKEQQLNIVDLQKTVAALEKLVFRSRILFRVLKSPNRWNSAACHDNLALSGPGRLTVQYTGKKKDWVSVRAEKPMAENPYFEVKIVEETTGTIQIGLATKRMPLDTFVGYRKGTYGYSDSGTFLGHEFEGCSHTFTGRPVVRGKPTFEEGDVPNYLYKKRGAFG
uniref:B30.2/SPRY domain-containing protein n=1 Tax=Globodera pallida TaxID=36090 RepID=A0A183CIK8_GLOPA